LYSGDFLCRFALPSEAAHWSLTGGQLKLVKIGAKIISHSRMTGLELVNAEEVIR